MGKIDSHVAAPFSVDRSTARFKGWMKIPFQLLNPLHLDGSFSSLRICLYLANIALIHCITNLSLACAMNRTTSEADDLSPEFPTTGSSKNLAGGQTLPGILQHPFFERLLCSFR